MKNKKWAIIPVIILGFVFLTGAGFAKNRIKLNANDNSISVRTSKDGAPVEYYFENGPVYSEENTTSRIIADNKVSYRIPSNWAEVEVNDKTKEKIFGIGTDEGNCYLLNAIDGDSTTEAFCIFNVDLGKYIKYDSDMNKWNAIEYAVISNICKEERSKLGITKRINISSERTPYGVTYDHYVGTHNSHRVEFVMTHSEDNLCVLMYVYDNNANHVQDVLYIMRTLTLE